MIPDQLLRLATNKTPSIQGDISDVIDIDTLRNIGVGTPLYVRINFNTAMRANVNDSGLAFELVVADNAALTTNRKVLCSTTIFVGIGNGPDANDVYYMPIPPIAEYAYAAETISIPDASKKYFGITYGGYTWGSLTGNFTIDIVTDINRVSNTYAKGFTVQ